MRRVNMEILIKYCQTVTLLSIRYIIQKRASRRWWKQCVHIVPLIHMDVWMYLALPRLCFTAEGSLQMHFIFQNHRYVSASRVSEEVLEQNRQRSVRSIRHMWPGWQRSRVRLFSPVRNVWQLLLRDMRWKCMWNLELWKMELSVELICTPFLTQVPMGNMDRQQSDCPGINLFRFTEKQRHSALFTTWFIRMLCLLELIVDMVQHRDFLPLRQQLMNWQKNSIWIRWNFVRWT